MAMVKDMPRWQVIMWRCRIVRKHFWRAFTDAIWGTWQNQWCYFIQDWDDTCEGNPYFHKSMEEDR